MNSTFTKEPVYPGLGIDFIVYQYSAPGRLHDTDGLDLPEEPFNEGDLRGQQAAFQLMAAAEKLPRENWDGWFITVMESAVQKLYQGVVGGAMEDTPSHRGAAIGMLHTLDQLLRAFAQTGLWRSVLIEQMGHYRSTKVEEQEQEIARLDEFIATMVAPPEIEQSSVKTKPVRKAATKRASAGAPA